MPRLHFIFAFMLFAIGPSSAVARHHAATIYRVDLMEIYTTKAAEMNGGEDAIRLRIQRAVAQLNSDFLMSGIGNVFFNLVYVGRMDFGAFAGRLELLNSLPQNVEVSAMRDAYGADLVGVWCEYEGGIAFAPSARYPTNAGMGFHVVAANPNVLDYLYMYSHEVGHNLGAMHENGPTEARGYCGEVRDLMAVGCYAPLARVFSSSDVKWEGHATGDASHDNVSAMRQLLPAVANYKH